MRHVLLYSSYHYNSVFLFSKYYSILRTERKGKKHWVGRNKKTIKSKFFQHKTISYTYSTDLFDQNRKVAINTKRIVYTCFATVINIVEKTKMSIRVHWAQDNSPNYENLNSALSTIVSRFADCHYVLVCKLSNFGAESYIVK